jgi:hypothetical protein
LRKPPSGGAAGATADAICPVCGTTFDPARYQVVIPGLREPAAFDTIECADIAVATSEGVELRSGRRRERRGPPENR